MELFWILCFPDLFADNEVVWIEMERLSPAFDSFGCFAIARELSSLAIQSLDLRDILGRQVIPVIIRGRGVDGLSRHEATDNIHILVIVDREATILGPLDRAGFIDQDAVWHCPEPEISARHTIFVDQHRERNASLLDEWSCQLGTIVFERDADYTASAVELFSTEMLPPGQLFAASSPGAPEEQEHAISPIVGKMMLMSVEIGQLQLWCLIAGGQ
jgi:hypothetical protein